MTLVLKFESREPIRLVSHNSTLRGKMLQRAISLTSSFDYDCLVKFENEGLRRIISILYKIVIIAFEYSID